MWCEAQSASLDRIHHLDNHAFMARLSASVALVLASDRLSAGIRAPAAS